MVEVESEVESKSRICPVPPGSKMGLNWRLRPRTIMVVSLTFMLTTGLVYVWLPRPQPIIIIDLPEDDPIIEYGFITIDGDTNFSDTALVEGWEGDGSPGNPFIIDRLHIDLGGEFGHCIMISNTRVSFTISNCNLAGANVTHQGFGMGPLLKGAGIHLLNVSNGELINNICNNNTGRGIVLEDSTYNTLANNTCNYNEIGICLDSSDSNTLVNNTCISNEWDGIQLGNYWEGSDHNTLANNTCNNNGCEGIDLAGSNHTTVVHNTCNNNDVGFFIDFSFHNTMANNTCTNNACGIIIYCGNHNTVIGNTCTNMLQSSTGPTGFGGGFGILVMTDFNTVANNTCNNNGGAGICISEPYNTVTNNTCTNNTVGIELGILSDSNTVENNTCTSNVIGIRLKGASYNSVENNTCISNEIGILLDSSLFIRSYWDGTLLGHLVFYWGESNYNTVTNNICNSNEIGICLEGSSYNTIANNTCNRNDIAICLNRTLEVIQRNNTECWAYSLSNTVANNTCNYNRVGIYLLDPHSNTVVNNTFLGNTEHDIFEDFTPRKLDTEVVLRSIGFFSSMGLITVTLLAAGLFVGKRVSKGE